MIFTAAQIKALWDDVRDLPAMTDVEVVEGPDYDHDGLVELRIEATQSGDFIGRNGLSIGY